ncbi:MAG TPA: hypothetical protein VGY48_00825 [Vicinamibacterales bacterium]|jgi:hypothetical protein|nr:hypothetical protein [Vicinamibacterales bacterium]
MSQFRVEKRRVEAELTLSGGQQLRGFFFLAGSTATHHGPELVVDLLNSGPGFFPFESAETSSAVLVNRDHVVSAHLLGAVEEAQLASGYDVATVRQVDMTLSNRVMLRGAVRVYLPEGRDRLSDYARSPERFRYLENAEGTFVVNTAHIVELSDIPEAPS